TLAGEPPIMDEIATYYAAAAPPPPPGAHHHHDPYYPPPHLIPLHHQQPPLVILTPAPSNPRDEDEDEVRTLFVAGLPGDVKAREIYHLFRECFQGINLLIYGDGRSTDSHLLLLCLQINGQRLMQGTHSIVQLRTLASNYENKDPGSDKRFKASAAFSRGCADPGVGSYHVPGMSNSAYNMIGYPSTQSRLSYDTRIIDQTRSVKPVCEYTLISSCPQNNSPCPTIFVANLGPACTERELTQIFSRTLLHPQKLWVSCKVESCDHLLMEKA
ncbi:hypothetical protein AKJ16_DCAP15444, partial [Drosera capensis]